MTVDLAKEDPEAKCICGHARINHYLRAGKYTDCAWCPHIDNVPTCKQWRDPNERKKT